MKIKDVRNLSVSDLNNKLQDLYKELYQLNNQRKINQVDKPHRFFIVKRDVARIQTVLTELKKGKDK
ncbi:MAG: 50S ribosomal protein L29 [Candidatus Gygaella obscura]|nr:50S ribosomal protein L29 [Candidatus Gygaella obscura]